MIFPMHVPGTFRQTRAVLLGLLAVLATLCLAAAPHPARAATTTVKVGQTASGAAGQGFNAAAVDISASDTLRWEWFNGTHDIHSANAPGLTSGPKGGFDSSGQVYQYTFSTPGTYTYYCDEHAGPEDAELAKIDQSLAGGKMVGKVVVRASGGSLSLSSKPIVFPAIALSAKDQTVDALPATWRASDTSGNGNGWSVTLTGASFIAASGTIPATGLKAQLLQSKVITVSGNAAPQTQVPSFQPLSATVPLKLLRAFAGTGMGTYDFTPDFRLTVPASTALGDYVASLVITISSGP